MHININKVKHILDLAEIFFGDRLSDDEKAILKVLLNGGIPKENLKAAKDAILKPVTPAGAGE